MSADHVLNEEGELRWKKEKITRCVSEAGVFDLDFDFDFDFLDGRGSAAEESCSGFCCSEISGEDSESLSEETTHNQ